MILWQIRQQVELLVNAETILSAADNLPNETFQVKFLNEQSCKLRAEIEKFEDLKTKLYQDLHEGTVAQDEYKDLHERFNRKLIEAKSSLAEIEEKKSRLTLKGLCDQQWLKDMKEYRNITVLDRKIVAALIDKVVVYSKERIEVNFCFADEIEVVISAAESQMVRNEEKRAAV